MAFKRAQVSTEILILVGIALFLLLPVLLYSYGRASVSGEDLAVQKAEFAASRLASLADSVGYLGGGAAIVDEIEVPPYVKGVGVSGSDIVFEMDTTTGKKQIVASTAFALEAVNLTGIARAGTYFIEVSSLSVTGTSGAQVRLRLS
jgi:hypothetical protein